jgi:glyoxylase-like metal-dependent hydrolase (beta-lactamase superfamily II)
MKEFKIKKISDKIYKIEETWFKEHANLYLLEGKKFDLLIDCGLGLFDLKEFLAKNGFKKVKVVLTHSHFDHVLGIKHFPPDDILINRKMYKNLDDKNKLALESLSLNDFDQKILSKKHIKNKKDILKGHDSFIPRIKQKEFKKIDNGFFTLISMDMPGHTDDSVVYYDKKKGILVTGDALYDGKIYLGFSDSSKKDFKKTLGRLAQLNFNLALPGHNKVFGKKKSLKIINEWNADLG